MLSRGQILPGPNDTKNFTEPLAPRRRGGSLKKPEDKNQ